MTFLTTLLVSTIPLFFALYALNFDEPLTADALFAIFQTNIYEAYEFVTDYISIQWILAYFVVTFFLAFSLIKQEKNEPLNIKPSVISFLIIIFIAITISLKDDLRVFKTVIHGFSNYKEELQLFQETQNQRKNNINFSAVKEQTGETYIVVIGESLNKNHMGIYGYHRNTTPQLTALQNNNELLVFNQAYSNHTHTMPVLSQALTEATQLNNKDYFDSLSIINILKKAGFETYWLTNQNLYGGYDNLVSIIANEADHLKGTNYSIGTTTSATNHDGVLIPLVSKILAKKSDKNRVIFVHLIGNHNKYCSRYPENFTIFNKQLKSNDFGLLAKKDEKFQDKLNCYDNSVYYNDYVVGSMLNLLKQTQSISGMIYFSDHADDVINAVGHNSAKFTYSMNQIPFLIWLSDSYKAEYSNKYNQMRSNQESLYSNDLVYDSIIGMLDVQTKHYTSTNDFTSPSYKLEADKAYTLHNEVLYTDPKNHIYWQKNNALYLIESHFDTRIIPHRVNSIGKLKELDYLGIHSYEVDVRFENNQLYVGHDDDKLGYTLEQFLMKTNTDKIKKLWLDTKNIEDGNAELILTHLNQLEQKFHFKSKAIVESSTNSKKFKLFQQNGWHTSYYLPTKEIKKLLRDNDIQKMREISITLADHSKTNNVSAVSFDEELYPFVKKYLENKLNKNVVYHTWHGPDLKDKEFRQKIKTLPFYSDPKIKTILFKFKSDFDL